MIGGFTQLHRTKLMKPSIPFMNDDLTYCVATSKVYPPYISMIHILTPQLWIVLYSFGYINGSILFVAQKFSKDEKKLDYHSCVLLFSHRLVVNSSTNLKPKSVWFRIYFFSVLLFGFFLFAYILSFLHFRVSHPYRPEQLSEKKILFENKFSFASSADILERIKLDGNVSPDLFNLEEIIGTHIYIYE